MTTTVLGIFDNALQARRAMERIQRDFLNIEDMSIITRATESGEPVSDNDHVTAGKGAAVGALWGGAIGLAALLIPGVGPFIAGGALFAGLTGAAAGAIVGGISGALIDRIGISADEAWQYEQLVQEGMTLIAVKCRPDDAESIRAVLASSGADEIHDGQNDDELGRTTGSVRTAMYAAGGNRLYADNGLFTPRGNTAVATAGLYAADHMATTPTGDEQITIGGTTVSRQNTPQPPVAPNIATGTPAAEEHRATSTGDKHWSGGQWVGEGQGEGPHDTGTFDAEQWVGEGQGEKDEKPEAKRPPQEPQKTRTTR